MPEKDSAHEPLFDAIVTGDAGAANELTKAALASGVDPETLIHGSMIPAMDEVGRRFEDEEYFVPELLLAARAMKSALALIRPRLVEKGAQPAGRVVIGTVRGDLHDIGKNLVASMLEGGGFEVVDLGTDVAPEKFVASVEESRPDLVCMSALLTVTMSSMKSTIEALEAGGLRDRVRVLVGGAPVSSQFAADIGADGFADNASAAVRVARELLT